ncbi:MAG: glycosyltransferase family 2 protein [Chloroflexota bacterium]|nr:glycosyltransferase family 2 protein [Chloroflexota bacterium]
MDASNDLGVVVLTHGPKGEYPPLLAALLDQGVPPESIAIAHNPVDASDPEIEPPDPGIAVLRMPKNLAYAGGMNAGIRHHLERGVRLVLLLTHDVRLRPGAVAALLDAAERAPEFGVLAPLIWARGEDRVFSYGGRSGCRGGWVEHILEGPPAASHGIAECDWADGAALLIRREVLEKVGVFDERLFIYFEETDLCLRARRAGWRVGVVLAAGAEQESGQPARPGFHAYLISRNGFEYARRVNGFVGVAATARRALVETWQLARSYRGADTDERAFARVKLIGMWLGFLDFLRHRFGPPPERVGRLGR